ncbi:hypothetical protein AYO21_11459 [Fonsecaea monophora]|uniref:Uncharacterized protein n=1 Tax=Fonsecaea monophora TaxID=254056 RepID=A0A177EQU6_9EURO|nr:hypothetical protein AYO21_11459 [Fonsecaea monophora]OAG34373.1 hypothetical protein AYO21_11459 [Fonsecaea monophora]
MDAFCFAGKTSRHKKLDLAPTKNTNTILPSPIYDHYASLVYYTLQEINTYFTLTTSSDTGRCYFSIPEAPAMSMKALKPEEIVAGINRKVEFLIESLAVEKKEKEALQERFAGLQSELNALQQHHSTSE